MPPITAPRQLGGSRMLSAAGALLDHLVGTEEQNLGDGEAQGLCGSDTDNQFEPGRLLDGQFVWSRALQDLVRVSGGTPLQIR